LSFNIIALYFNVVAGFCSIAIHAWLAVVYVRLGARRRAILMYGICIISIAFSIIYILILLYPEWYLFLAQNLFRVTIGATLIVMSLSSLLVYRFHQEEIVGTAELQKVKNQIINNVGHEIRTPITIIIGYVELLLAGEFGLYPDAIKSPLDSIHNNSKRINIIVRRMLTLLRAYDPEQFDLLSLVCNIADGDEVWISTRRKLGSSNIVCGGADITIYADKDKIFTAAFEMIHNAIKFSSGDIRVTILSESEYAKIIVHDDGIGINPEHHALIFEPFVQLRMDTSRPYEGTGMGLTVVQHVAELHRGHIEVESKLGGGATFTLVLPKEGAQW